MKPPFHARAPSFDGQAIHATIQRALASAGLDTGTGPMRGVTETLRRALAPGPLAEAPQRPGGLATHHFSNAAGTRAYKLHVPAVLPDGPPPLLVMLHGCTQSADDFATGTQMNRLADAHGFLVVYPEQPAQANPSACWNWFRPQDQAGDGGEPSLIAGIVREVAQRHGADPRRIFVAGLSAGAAMAVVLGETCPDLFAGVGAHSGLPYASAHDIPSALAAMKGGRSGLPALKNLPGAAAGGGRKAVQAVPVIVFHGDRDHTVQPANGEAIVQQARAAHAAEAGGGLQAVTHTGQAPGGRRYSRAVHTDALGHTRIEHWTVHGAGHAWSGGHASGSHTDGAGPDASAEMVRFFLALPHGGTA
ncbi:extracellular catalytic domain type 1 short-chain-length polyhydroxyalkanoate depolymerase [Pseudaquabacterium pictum]|uniref:Poly(3-hydroxybutyrate) depolymerase n=1 Tax=Pseudaquabacterium pictum TaxID=2315236 RepID=A0A480APV8_9BURK|nr:PHB depolymerase family esterase [Rubrivivax pictus]GCL63046.1 poly(3-hydroxybutyrate) depolymerase [Rubrivivax pictus]